MTKSSEIKTIGIVGAGTMGAGIALTALYAGKRVILQDAFPEVLENAEAYIEKFLAKKGLPEFRSNLQLAEQLAMLEPSELVIEAAPEKLDIKRQIFAELEQICASDAILATNTSTLSVTAIAAGMQHPERVAGMHFFNPAPVLPLVEIVRAAQSAPDAIAALETLTNDLGKTPVITSDSPGFIVNRVARPFYGEALRILGEGAASHEQIDQIVESAGGFRMGPFRLMDLIGIDINAGAMRSMYEQTFGEPRYRPHPIQIRKLAEGALGRKSGRGFYDYAQENLPPKDEKPLQASKSSGEVWLSQGSWASCLSEILQSSGYAIVKPSRASKPKAAFLQAGRGEAAFEELRLLAEFLPPHTPLFVQTADMALSEFIQLGFAPHLIGFDGLFLSNAKLVTLQQHAQLSEKARQGAEEICIGLGKRVLWLKESPALVLPRIISQLVNEAAFALQEGVADAETIDLAMRLGVNYPQGPLEWGAQIGYAKILAILDHLYAEFHEERYRACTLLRRWSRTPQASQ